jgi:hypothetical protein
MGREFRTHEIRNTNNILVGIPEGKRLLGTHRRGWVDNIKLDLKRTGCESVNWIHLAQDRDKWRDLVNSVIFLRGP